MSELRVERLHPDAVLPHRAYPTDAGLDLHTVGEHVIDPGTGKDIPTGIAVEFPDGVWGRITGRSSTFRQRRLLVLEGIIDHGYRGELFAFVTNMGSEAVTIRTGERLAQLVLSPIVAGKPTWVDRLNESERGTNGFGSTGRGHTDHPGPQTGTEIPSLGSRDTHDAEGYPVGPSWLDEAPSHSLTRRAAMSEDTHASAARASWSELHANESVGSVYLGGPIDHADRNPDQRHALLLSAMLDAHVDPEGVYCPYCKQMAEQSEPIARMHLNTVTLDVATWAVFDWSWSEPSIGTPVEIHRRVTQGKADRTIIVGDPGDGLFAQVWLAAGVSVVDSMDKAVAVMAGAEAKNGRERVGS